jgi:hypothetical protein
MIQQLENVLNKLSELSEAEQEAIAQMILTTIEDKKQGKNKMSSDNNDPLAELRNSDFIGCFSGEPDLAEKSEQIAQEIISKKY